MRSGGGVSDLLYQFSDTSEKDYYLRWAFDIGFFVIVNLILLGIFFGIVVDSFAEFKAKMKQKEDSNMNECYLCGLKRDRIEKNGIKF